MKKITILVLLLCLSFSLILQDYVLARPQKHYTLAVLFFNDEQGELTETDVRLLTQAFGAELARLDLFHIMPQPNVERLLLDYGINPFACSAVDCLTRAGNILRTELIVTANVRHVQGTYAIDLKMRHVSSKQIVRSFSDGGYASVDILLNSMDALVKGLVGLRAQVPTASENGSFLAEYQNKRGGFRWALLGLGVVVAGAVSAGVLLAQKDSNTAPGETSNTPPSLDAPPSFP